MKKLLLLVMFVFFATAGVAQEATTPAVTGWVDFGEGLWKVVVGYLTNPFVITFLMTQARAAFPFLGKLGVFTILGDIIAGNWGAAKNAK